MPTRELLTPAQRLRLDELPIDLDDRLMACHHALSEDDLAIVRRCRGPSNRLGLAVLLALLRFTGRPLRPGERAPEKIVRYVASPGRRGSQGDGLLRQRTREHAARAPLGDLEDCRLPTVRRGREREAARWLLGVAAMTDSAIALLKALLEEMRRHCVVASTLYAVEEPAW
jgi:hypothetical protein